MRHSVRVGWAGLASLALATAAAVGTGSGAGAAINATSAASPVKYTVSGSPISVVGTINLSSAAAAAAAAQARAASGTAAYRVAPLRRPAAISNGPAAVPSTATAPTPVAAGQVPGETGFVGLTGVAQASVKGGLDLEPPDQGLCAGQGVVADFVNDALQVYTTSGSALSPAISPAAVFDTPNLSGFAFSDPRCYYDAPTQRWFFSEFTVGTVDGSGHELTPSVQYLAVSNTTYVLGSYTVYAIDTTHAGAPGCPCFGDYDQLGADDNGVYIATNEFGVASSAFHGAVVYAVSKQLLEAYSSTGLAPVAFAYRITHDYFGQPYHVSPSSTPPGALFAAGTEYFVESNSNAASDSHLAVFALSNTSELAAATPPSLVATETATEGYAFPPDATQKAGRIPLGRANQDPEGVLQADFNAVQEVTYTNGQLYAEADSAGPGGDRVAWFVLTPTLSSTSSSTSLSASVSSQGYVSVAGQNLIYPDVVVNASGHGFIDFTLSGPAYFPSAAYVAFGPTGPSGSIHVAGAGAAPEDGFTCYSAYVGPNYGGCRWGDYSGGAVMGSRVYMATEMIPASSRDLLTNWGTYVWSVPAGS